MSNDDSGSSVGISDDQAISRMFDLVQNGQVDNSEFALLDAVIQSRLRKAYDEGKPQTAVVVQLAD